jgi:ACR3 family arsenite transporter
LGTVIGYLFPKIDKIIAKYQIGSSNIPIAIGLILIMYLPLAKVRYEKILKIFKNEQILYSNPTIFILPF